MGRRGLHNEGSQTLMDRLAGKIDIDFDTARRLFRWSACCNCELTCLPSARSILFCAA